jgi:outer membrane protein assembly factor BamB
MPWLHSLLALFLCAAAAAAGDWPQWLGPSRDGVSPEKVAPWKQAPQVVWRQAVGRGHSSPVVADGKVFLHAKVDRQDAEEVRAFDARTGRPIWHKDYPRAAFKSEFGDGPRATPTVADGRVYAFGVTGVLSCFDTEKGEIVWQVDTLKRFQAKNLFFGMSCSPLLEAGKVLVNVGGEKASVVAFNKDNGEVVWKSLDDKASYSSPIVFGQGGGRQVVLLTQQGLVSLNPADGSVFWKFPMKDLLSESSTTPVRVGDMLVASSVTLGSYGLRLGTKDVKPSAEQVWKEPALTCYFATPVPVGKDHLYMVTGSILPPKALLRCVDPRTGKDLWQNPRPVGKYHATLLRTGDDKLLLLEEAGNLALLEPNPNEYRELARAKVCGETWAHPALADGLLYVRDAKELLCLKLGD